MKLFSKVCIAVTLVRLVIVAALMAFFVMCYSSCSTVKRTRSKEKIESTVTYDKKQDSIQLKVNDSSHTKVDTTKSTVKTDSVFKKKTVIRENIRIGKDSVKTISRVITIEEEGKKESTAEVKEGKSEKTESNNIEYSKKSNSEVFAKWVKEDRSNKFLGRSRPAFSLVSTLVFLVCGLVALSIFFPGLVPRIWSWIKKVFALFKRKKKET